MTLSATNGIKEAGVGATFYGVDKPQCTPTNAAECKTYAGPFEIKRSGKHTVTFSSQNAQGYPEAIQSEQVWVDKDSPVITVSAKMLRPHHEKEEDHRIVRIAISGNITDQLSGVDASSAAYMVDDDDAVLQASGALTLVPDGTYSLVVSFKRTHHREDGDEDEHWRNRKKYKIIVGARDNAGNHGSASAFAARESH